ncbi:MAG: 50S ribosomal protein L3 [Proteobacteria bacterium]|nr:50S ribosomal protein L3 [Pseudomonadota bacterium]
MSGKKIGTTQVFHDNGVSDAVTALVVGPCVVTQIKTIENDGYASAQLGFEPIRGLNKPREGHLKRVDGLYRFLREVYADDPSELEVGQSIDVSIFETGEKVDAIASSKGRGFAGGVKRWGFPGGPKTPGQSDRHRAPGSIGAGTSPGRVLKGLKMAGHFGNARITSRNLEVVSVDQERNILLLKGSVPGARNSLVLVRKAGRRRK